MSLKPFVESLEDVAEALQGEYVEVDGGYQLEVLSGYVSKDKVEDVSGLKSALHKERDNARTAARRARELEDQFGGFDPEELTTLRNEKAKAEEDRKMKAGEWDLLKKQMNEKQAAELEARDSKINSLRKAYDNQLIDSAVVTAIAESKGNATLLKPHVAAHVKVVQEESGAFSVQVVDDAGNPRVDGNGQFLKVSDYVKEMRENDTYAGAFIGTQSSGGGTAPGGGKGEGAGKKGGIPSDLKRSSMTARQKIDFIREFSDEDYQRLPL